ncbi:MULTISPECIES: glutathione S-transferase family protein [Sinorhizobium]|jgi:glutathione S-transferase|uniref:glutathione S-transferase family protein n=1 Tax=Sinorhizobium TaxID=28105 RepID=UPI000FD84303|nr:MULTISPECIES: glutathione S-transferase family protein [Sinorhizobium]MCG5484532.1 glutathione S-transferase family protein [Sinorhizobium meliloti]RVP98595.1 glutathione S-transferase family protein [Sinorhizobium meliloti]WEJ10066.1 glutathione S-transferase family protein [Sinorhizobium sp. M103]WEJ15379.1 glutathione S-transferase family protein [Sinorhizobium sp. K101]WEJ37030.1 glutathione S-transferase family protein [Sinorhizobium sp. C101]
MTKLVLYVGNKNYSSWSMRPWLALTACGIPFEDVVIPFDFAAGNPRFREISPTGRVPVLHHGENRVWESLAIIEYAAELFPDAGLWPEERADRARARSYSMEMLSGFRALRGACPMNIRRPRKSIALPDGVSEDVARIETIWRESVERSGGPFLFGRFTAADAMFAPVVNRFETYELVTDPATLAYMDAVKAHPAFRRWEEAARAEPWIVPEDEA